MADQPEDPSSYDVGYGKPPKHTQFQPGTSGNRRGRPRGSKNLAAIVLREARKKVRVNGPRGPRSVMKVEATVMQLANQSAQGDLAAQRQFLPLVRESEESLSSDSTPASVHESDQLVMRNMLRRIWERRGTEQTTDTEAAKGEGE